MSFFSLASCWLSFILLVSSSAVYSNTFFINKDHSQVLFEIDYLKIGTITGSFGEISGNTKYNEETNELDYIEIKIKSNSIQTSNRLRDNHLKESDFFYVKKYPLIKFESTKINKREGYFDIEGTLTIKGISKKVGFKSSYKGKEKDSWNKFSHFFSFSSQINRKDFDLNWNRTIDGNEVLLGNTVKINGIIQIQPQGKKTEWSKHYIPKEKSIKKSIGPQTNIKVAKLPEYKQKNLIPEDKSKDLKGPYYYLGLFILGLFGMAGTIWGCFYVKGLLAHKKGRKWEITGDMIVLFICLIYCMGFYFAL